MQHIWSLNDDCTQMLASWDLTDLRVSHSRAQEASQADCVLVKNEQDRMELGQIAPCSLQPVSGNLELPDPSAKKS